MARYRYVSTFCDRHGHHRAYFKRPGYHTTTLPVPVGSAEFLGAYEKALLAVPDDARDVKQASVAVIKRQREWSGRRLQAYISNLMGDSGVYLLLRQGRVVYVGSSRNCAQRIKDHRTAGRPFDKAFYIYAEEAERAALEVVLIRQLAPEQNKIWNRASNPIGLIQAEGSNPAEKSADN